MSHVRRTVQSPVQAVRRASTHAARSSLHTSSLIAERHRRGLWNKCLCGAIAECMSHAPSSRRDQPLLATGRPSSSPPHARLRAPPTPPMDCEAGAVAGAREVGGGERWRSVGDEDRHAAFFLTIADEKNKPEFCKSDPRRRGGGGEVGISQSTRVLPPSTELLPRSGRSLLVALALSSPSRSRQSRATSRCAVLFYSFPASHSLPHSAPPLPAHSLPTEGRGEGAMTTPIPCVCVRGAPRGPMSTWTEPFPQWCPQRG